MRSLTSFPPSTDAQKDQASQWFQSLQTVICSGLEALESEFDSVGEPPRFRRETWERSGGGGGCMALLQGRLFEKAGVNVSTVFGEFSQEFSAAIPGAGQDPRFWASGLSLVIHPRSPHVPIVHMNTRHIVTTTSWFGGGIDLTPVFPDGEQTGFFHQHLEQVCNCFDPTFYPKFKEWADTYFYLPHRGEMRGVGGIFYDDLVVREDWDVSMEFTKAVGEAFLDVYAPLVRQNWHKPVSASDLEAQLRKRGRYVEFNLLYDRGTLFGLKTGGKTEAILMSLPPLAGWLGPVNP